MIDQTLRGSGENRKKLQVRCGGRRNAGICTSPPPTSLLFSSSRATGRPHMSKKNRIKSQLFAHLRWLTLPVAHLVGRSPALLRTRARLAATASSSSLHTAVVWFWQLQQLAGQPQQPQSNPDRQSAVALRQHGTQIRGMSMLSSMKLRSLAGILRGGGRSSPGLVAAGQHSGTMFNVRRNSSSGVGVTKSQKHLLSEFKGVRGPQSEEVSGRDSRGLALSDSWESAHVSTC